MNHGKTLSTALGLILAGLTYASTAEAAKPVPGLKVVMREYFRTFELAPGESTLVSSMCLRGETALSGTPSAWSANVTMVVGHLVYDGIDSGWTFEYRNDGTETVTSYAATSALCTAGTLTYEASN